MNSYMTAQAQKANEQTTFVINGEVSLFSNSVRQKEVARKFSETMDWEDAPFENEIKQLLPSWFCIKQKKGEGTFIQSCCDKSQLDEGGRRMGFQFFCETEDIDISIKELRKCASLAKRKLDDTEFENLKKAIETFKEKEIEKKKKIIGVLVASFILLVTIISISNICTKSEQTKTDSTVIDTIKTEPSWQN